MTAAAHIDAMTVVLRRFTNAPINDRSPVATISVTSAIGTPSPSGVLGRAAARLEHVPPLTKGEDPSTSLTQ